MPSVQVRLVDPLGAVIDMTTLSELPVVGDRLHYNNEVYEVLYRTWTPQRRKDHEAILTLRRIGDYPMTTPAGAPADDDSLPTTPPAKPAKAARPRKATS